MYLVVADHGNSSLMMVLWGWASGKKRYKDMRRFIVEKLGPGTYIYREDEEVKRALYNIQWRYGKDESGKNRLRVLRVAESDVDLLKEIELINQREGMQASEGKNLSTTLSEDEIKIQIARRVYEALPDIGVEKRRAVFAWILRAEEPAGVDTEEISLRYGLGGGVALTLLNYIRIDPRVRVELREMGYNDEQLPDWVPADSDTRIREP